MKKNMVKNNKTSNKTLATITDDCNDVLAFLQSAAVKSPQVIAAPLYLRADKRVRVWFRRWYETNLPTPTKNDPQDHMDLTGLLSTLATSFHTTKALCPDISAQREAGKETKGWYRLLSIAQQVILEASATNRTSIPTLPPPTLHFFLNTHNAKALQSNCSLTYIGNILYLRTSFFRALRQGQIMVISDYEAPTGLLPLLTYPSSAGPANSQQQAMRIQVPLSMVQDCLSKE